MPEQKADRLIVSLDLALPIDPAEDPMEYVAMFDQLKGTLARVYGIEIKHVAGTVAEGVYDANALVDEVLAIGDGDPDQPELTIDEISDAIMSGWDAAGLDLPKAAAAVLETVRNHA
jgi:hypothetical protein